MTDQELADMATPARNAMLDALEAEAEAAYAEWEVRAEQANERWFEERGGGYYAGSPEEARDRWLDSLTEGGAL